MQTLSTYYCDEKLLAAIGSIVLESAYLERYIETMLYRLTRLSRPLGHPLIEKGMMDAKLEALKEICRSKLARRPKHFAELSDIISDLRQNNTDRSIAVHGVWTPEVTYKPGLFGEAVFGPPRASKRKGHQGDAIMTAARAMELAKDISDGHSALHAFSKRTWRRLFPGPMPIRPPLPLGPPLSENQKRANKRGSSQQR